jgi:hypothetical protein
VDVDITDRSHQEDELLNAFESLTDEQFAAVVAFAYAMTGAEWIEWFPEEVARLEALHASG